PSILSLIRDYHLQLILHASDLLLYQLLPIFEQFSELLYGLTAMTDTIFFLGREFCHCDRVAIWNEDGVITKTKVTSWFLSNFAIAITRTNNCFLPWCCDGNDTYKTSGPIFTRNIFQFR